MFRRTIPVQKLGLTEVASAGVSGYTLLHFAANSGEDEVTRMLIERGADVNERTEEGESVLASATPWDFRRSRDLKPAQAVCRARRGLCPVCTKRDL